MTEIATYFTNTVAVLVFSLLTLLLTLHVVRVLHPKNVQEGSTPTSGRRGLESWI
jgi:hypothetical protein